MTSARTRSGRPHAAATRVLVVEDDPAIRGLVRYDLEQAGVAVAEAQDVREALAAIADATFDVVILDLTLPDGSGFEVLDHLRDGGATTHVIVLSGASTPSERVRGLEQGADDYVIKPFSASELTARVRAVGRRRAGTRRVVRDHGALEAAALRRGLARGEFAVHYQPVVDLASRRTITLEALARWNHPERGLLGPDAFIDTAVRSGLIVDLGTFVLASACRQTATWRRGGADINVAVNLSARELAEPSLVEHLTSTVEAAGLDLRSLWLEVTETSLVEDVGQVGQRLDRLASLGVGVSIDDFGTGWASLTYLREFPVHVLKIDRSFVTGIDHDASNVAIVRSIVSLGAELDLVVVAEGIETEAEHRSLLSLGCTVGQGFLYSRPTAAEEVDLTTVRRLQPTAARCQRS